MRGSFVPEGSPKAPAASRASVARLMVPTEANFSGNVFGGALLAEVDRVAYISATRHSQRICVTASFDRVDFLAPVHVGEVVDFDARVTYVGHTSMEVWVTIRSEPALGGPRRLVGNAFVTMVAVDPSGRPVPVPPLKLDTAEDHKRFGEAEQRMEQRRRTRPHEPTGDSGPRPPKAGGR